ncbi:type II toxin-antitoxin system RelE/ParE family toxin [Corynebacterium sp. AOP34-AQ2-28]|uniref:type II toxin-antitoxin system RelE/ParE family toxin n=1 Tax=Corynebacterium sp. AOP34-AQ2-28 TaxID=3457689 RepID=UPI004033C1E9
MEFRRSSLQRFHTTGAPPKYIPPELRAAVRRKLVMIARATNINDLRVPPTNRLERLSGNLDDYHSIRINSQWRIIFIWTDKGAVDVDFIDYHR